MRSRVGDGVKGWEQKRGPRGVDNYLTWQKCFPFPVSGNEVNISPGRRFMIDLLVGSLMADGGLESALNAAITAEIQVCFWECVCELTEVIFTCQ